MGVRDHEQIPIHTEVTNKDLMIYRVAMELEEVVEQRWYKEKRKFGNMEAGLNQKMVGTEKIIKIAGH